MSLARVSNCRFKASNLRRKSCLRLSVAIKKRFRLWHLIVPEEVPLACASSRRFQFCLLAYCEYFSVSLKHEWISLAKWRGKQIHKRIDVKGKKVRLNSQVIGMQTLNENTNSEPNVFKIKPDSRISNMELINGLLCLKRCISCDRFVRSTNVVDKIPIVNKAIMNWAGFIDLSYDHK